MTGFHAATLVLRVFALTGLLAVSAVFPVPANLQSTSAMDLAKPTMEPLVQFEFDPPQWGMPDATTWTHLDFSITELDAGRTWDTSQGWYTSTDGPLLISVLDGELIITPAGPSLVHRGDAGDRPPVENSAGTEITLEPGDGIIYSIHDAAMARNPGTEAMHVLIGLAGSEDFSVPGAYAYPVDADLGIFDYEDGMPPPATAGAHVSLQQLVLHPYDAFAFHDVEEMRAIALLITTGSVYWVQGEFDMAPPSARTRFVSQTTVFHSLGRGGYTMVNLGAEPVTVYLFVVEPAGTPEREAGA